MKRLLTMLGAAAIALGMHAAECVYTSGDTSLADGRILFEYDDAGKITRLSLAPASGETLAMSGDALAFASGAEVALGSDGESVVANAFTTAGTLNFKGGGAGSRLTFRLSANLTLSQPFAGSGVTLVFDAAAANVTVTASAAANTMTDTAYVVNGDAEHRLTFIANHKDALPSGTIDVYGQGTTLRISKGGSDYKDGISSGKCAINIHPGSVLVSMASWPFYSSQQISLDGAKLSVDSNNKYINELTLKNGSKVETYGNNPKSRLGYGQNSHWTVTGTGASTCTLPLILYSNGNTQCWIVFNVNDTVAGDEADFIVSGDMSIDSSSHKRAVFEKKLAGTMRIDGNFRLTNDAAWVTAGTLLINKSDSTTSAVKFSLRGGTLGFGEGTSNTTGAIDLTNTTASKIAMGKGASLVAANLTVPSGAVLSVVGDVRGQSVKVGTKLDAATLSRIRVNGKRAAQTDDGYLVARGFSIVLR